MSWTRRVALSLLCVLGASRGSAVAFEAFPLVGDEALGALVVVALRENPQLQAAQASLEAARSRVPQAGALPDPVLTTSYQNGGRGWSPGSDDDTGLRVGVAQEFPLGGKRRFAEQVESREVARAGLRMENVRRAVEYQVRLAYAQLLLVRENLRILEDQRRATRDIEELSRSRYAVGLADQSDVLRAQAELARLDQMRLHQEGLEVSASADVNRLLARPAATPVETGARLAALGEREIHPPSLDEVLASVDMMSSDLAVSAATVARSQAALELARREGAPNLIAGASYFARGSLPPMFSVDLGVVLPLYKGRKQSQAVAEAASRLRSDAALREATRLLARAEAEKSLADLRAALGEADAYAHGVLTVDALAAESAIAGFQAGKAPFVAVLEAHNTFYRDRWQYADLLFHVLWHGARLDSWILEGSVTLP